MSKKQAKVAFFLLSMAVATVLAVLGLIGEFWALRELFNVDRDIAFAAAWVTMTLRLAHRAQREKS